MSELQRKWIAGILSNRISLPSKVEMMEDVKALYSSLETSGTPKHYAHFLGKGQVCVQLINFNVFSFLMMF